MGIRQKLAAEFSSTPNKQGNLGRQHTTNMTVTNLHTEKYHELAPQVKLPEATRVPWHQGEKQKISDNIQKFTSCAPPKSKRFWSGTRVAAPLASPQVSTLCFLWCLTRRWLERVHGRHHGSRVHSCDNSGDTMSCYLYCISSDHIMCVCQDY
jgi:hypothetical protein